jgi:hypothetical protein
LVWFHNNASWFCFMSFNLWSALQFEINRFSVK